MNLEKVIFGFFIIFACTLNFGFFIGDIERPEWSKELLVRTLRGSTTGDVPRDPDDPYVRTIVGGRLRIVAVHPGNRSTVWSPPHGTCR